MGVETGIAWTDHTFNPWWGCQRVSPGCEHCYAETWDARFGGQHWGAKSERRFFGDKHWNEPRKWDKAAGAEGRRARVFCASMADVFEDRRDLDGQRMRLWHLIIDTPHLDWQLLTKRPENLPKLLPPDWLDSPLPNVWLGVTAEDQRRFNERAPRLCSVPASVRFLSVEPQIESIEPRPWLHGPQAIDWLIIGGESGAGARPFDPEWARLLIRRGKEAGTAIFVKQLGGVHDKRGDPSFWPADLRVREFPPSGLRAAPPATPPAEPPKP